MSTRLSSNSQTTISQMNRVQRNAKGHPTTGMLTLQRNKHVYHYLDGCHTLENTSAILQHLYQLNGDDADVKSWRRDVFNKLFEFVNVKMVPTVHDIDCMMLVCRVLLDNHKKREFQEFIQNCPNQFIIIYANNSEVALP